MTDLNINQTEESDKPQGLHQAPGGRKNQRQPKAPMSARNFYRSSLQESGSSFKTDQKQMGISLDDNSNQVPMTGNRPNKGGFNKAQAQSSKLDFGETNRPNTTKASGPSMFTFAQPKGGAGAARGDQSSRGGKNSLDQLRKLGKQPQSKQNSKDSNEAGSFQKDLEEIKSIIEQAAKSNGQQRTSMAQLTAEVVVWIDTRNIG